MIIISHRGNINGRIPERENTPTFIDSAILSGYEVEIDVRYIDNNFYLGHDTPDYLVTIEWLEKRKEKLWLHCKDLDSAIMLGNLKNFKYFCHNSDSYVLTSTNHIWVHDLSLNINNKVIIPLLDEKDILNFNHKLPYAICTDYVNLAKFNLKQKGLYV